MSTGREDSRNDAVVGFGTGTSFIRSSMKSVIKALSGPRLATPLTDAEDGAKETDRNLIDDFSEELPPNESSSSVR